MMPKSATLVSSLPGLSGATPLSRGVRGLGLALAGSALIALSAKMQVPFWPVPMTMQTFAIIVLAMAFGPRLGAATVGLYLLEGALGLPVFAGTPEKGIGLAYMAGPTGGYLVGFLAAAGLAGWMAERGWDRSFLKAAAVNALATGLIFACGLSWLAVLIGPAKAVAVGLTPFLAASVLKIALGGAIMPLAWSFARRLRG